MGFETPSLIMTGATVADSLKYMESKGIKVFYKPLQSENLRKKMIEVLNL